MGITPSTYQDCVATFEGVWFEIKPWQMHVCCQEYTIYRACGGKYPLL
jgi:hypothetical protein